MRTLKLHRDKSEKTRLNSNGFSSQIEKDETVLSSEHENSKSLDDIDNYIFGEILDSSFYHSGK